MSSIPLAVSTSPGEANKYFCPASSLSPYPSESCLCGDGTTLALGGFPRVMGEEMASAVSAFVVDGRI